MTAAAHPRRRVRLDPSLALATAAALALFAPGACSYSPNIDSGSLLCSLKGECPRGFTCAASGPSAGRCVTGSGMDGGTGGSGAGGSGTPSASPASYIGTWVFDPASMVSQDCGLGSAPQVTSLKDSKLQIYATTKGANILGASWSVWNRSDCAYELYLDGLGAHLNDFSWSCQDATQDPAKYSTHWTADSFDVVTSNGLTATHDAQYIQGFLYTDGTTLYCDQTVHAVMNRR